MGTYLPKQKHRFIMYLIRKVANRQAGMGLKIVKFHAIVHMADDMIKFGVPMNFDPGSDESGHKATKTATVVTQKRKERFGTQRGGGTAKTGPTPRDVAVLVWGEYGERWRERIIHRKPEQVATLEQDDISVTSSLLG